MSTNVCAKFRCAQLRIKKALEISRELIPTRTRTTRVAFCAPSSGSKNFIQWHHSCRTLFSLHHYRTEKMANFKWKLKTYLYELQCHVTNNIRRGAFVAFLWFWRRVRCRDL